MLLLSCKYKTTLEIEKSLIIKLIHVLFLKNIFIFIMKSKSNYHIEVKIFSFLYINKVKYHILYYF